MGADQVTLGRLTRLLPDLRDLARALGTRTRVVRRWGEGVAPPAQVAARAELLLGVADELAPAFGSSAEIGRWLLTPQRALHHTCPAAVLAARGPEALPKVLASAGAGSTPAGTTGAAGRG